MKRSLLIIGTATAIVTIITYIVGGSNLVLEGLIISKRTATQSILMLLASFLVIGQIQVLLTKEVLDNWLRKFSGIKGVLLSALAGGLFPGGPYIFYPFILSFKELPFYILISAIFGKNLYDFSRFSMEVSLVSFNIAVVRNLITLPIPVFVGLLAKRLYNDKTIGQIFLGVGEDSDSDNYNS